MGHYLVKALFFALAFGIVLAAAVGLASAQDTGKMYLISVEDSLNGSYLGGPDMLVNVGNVSRTTMTEPLIIMGSGVDAEERQIAGTILGDNFDKSHVLGDSATTFDGTGISDHDLIVIGGPNHNAYTKMLLDAGYLKYTATDKKVPTMIFEVLTGPGGHKVAIIGDAGGYPYHKKDLPLNGIIPEELAPAAAVIAGLGLGLIGTLLSPLSGFLSNAVTFLSGLVGSHLVEVTSKANAGVTKADSKKVGLFGFSSVEVALALAVSAILGLAYVFAGRELFTPVNIVIYLIVAGVATVAHDLAHKRAALKYKVKAEYKFWTLGTAIVVLTSWLFGSVFAYPARTLTDGAGLSRKEEAAIALAGPRASAQLATLFLLLIPLKYTAWGGAFAIVGVLGFSINALAAVYSLIPFEPMDGGKLFRWSKPRWALWFVPLLALYLAVMVFVL